MTLDQLRAKANDCKQCRLSARRNHVVFGEGNPSSPLVLVGEGPGEEEDRTGRPFVGRAGQLLDRALADAGLDRTMVYICNTVKCRACDWDGDKAANRPPSTEETAACRRWLLPQLAAIRPEVLLCLGAPSAKNLINPDFKITRERGKYFPCDFARTAIATMHPAYILRNGGGGADGGYPLLVADITRAWAAALQLRDGRAVVHIAEREPTGDR
ncbi:MAG: uracil-DNA glycosylase family protein [Fimbriimonadaceae bacterium]